MGSRLPAPADIGGPERVAADLKGRLRPAAGPRFDQIMLCIGE
jgi:hypothetical protein